VIGGGKLMGQVLSLADESAARIAEHYNAELRPSLARILVDAAAVEVRRVTGENVETAEIAVRASLANLTLLQGNLVRAEARELAFRAALSLIGLLLPPV
jgi:hypothetical protein